jgi:hypothetical protein
MAPRNSTRRQPEPTSQPQAVQVNNGPVNDELFLDPMLGSPLSFYIEKDVADRDVIVDAIIVSRVIKSRRNIKESSSLAAISRGYSKPWKIHVPLLLSWWET